MQPKNAFRATLAGSLACSISYVLVSVYTERYLPLELREHLEQQYAAELTMSELVAVAIGIPFIIATLVNVIFLFCFRAKARPWALFLTLAALPLYILLGPWVETGIAHFLDEMAAVLWGAALALMYCPPISSLFVLGAADPGVPRKTGTERAISDEPMGL